MKDIHNATIRECDEITPDEDVPIAVVVKLKPVGGAYDPFIPSRITLDDLLEAAKDLDWSRQAQSLGIRQAAATA